VVLFTTGSISRHLEGIVVKAWIMISVRHKIVMIYSPIKHFILELVQLRLQAIAKSFWLGYSILILALENDKVDALKNDYSFLNVGNRRDRNAYW